MVNQCDRTLLLRFGQSSALTVMAGLGVLDLNSGMTGTGGFVLLQILSAMATAAVWLPRHQQGSTTLPKVAVAVSCASLLLTFGVLLNGTTHGSFGSAEALGLLGILYVVS